MAGTKHIPNAIAPSAAGIDYQDLHDRKCPKPIPVMVMCRYLKKLIMVAWLIPDALMA